MQKAVVQSLTLRVTLKAFPGGLLKVNEDATLSSALPQHDVISFPEKAKPLVALQKPSPREPQYHVPTTNEAEQRPSENMAMPTALGLAASAPEKPLDAPLDAGLFDMSMARPEYPQLSRVLNEAGTVMLRVQLSGEGAVADVKIAQSSGYPRLDMAAQSAAIHWHLGHGSSAENGLVPGAWYVVPVHFRLLTS